MVRCGSVHRIQHREEVFEETGCTVHSKKLIAVQDWRKHNVMNHAYGVIKTFMLCQYESGTFKSNIETTEIGLFDRTSLPNDLAIEKTTKDQILMCFDFYEKPDASTLFD